MMYNNGWNRVIECNDITDVMRKRLGILEW